MHEARRTGSTIVTIVANAAIFLMRHYDEENDEEISINVRSREEVSIVCPTRLLVTALGFEGEITFDP